MSTAPESGDNAAPATRTPPEVLPRLGASTLSGLVALAPALLISLVTAGLMLRVMGTVIYGVWAVATALLLYLSLADFGLGSAVQRFMSEYRVRGAHKQQATFIGTLVTAYVVVGTVVVGVSAGIGLVLPSLTGHAVGADETLPTALLLGSAVAFTLWMNAALGALHAWQMLPMANLVRGLYGVGAGVAPLIMVVLGLGLKGAALGVAVNSLASFGVAVALARRKIPSLGVAAPSRAVARQVLKYSTLMFATGVGAMIVFGADSIVIGAALGPAAVPAYALALKGTRSATLGLHKLADALFPTFAALKATDDLAGARRWYAIAARAELAGAVFLALFLLPAGHTILRLWLGPSNVLVLPAFALALLLIILEAAVHPPAILAGAAGGERSLAGVNSLEALANIALSLALVRPWGVTGVIAGTVLAEIGTNLWWLPRWAKRYLDWSWADYVAEIFAPSFVPGAVGAVTAAAAWLVLQQANLGAAGLLSGFAGGTAFVLAYTLPFPERPEVRRMISLAALLRSQLHKNARDGTAAPGSVR